MPKKYDIGDWITWNSIIGRESRVCSDCGQRVYGINILDKITGKIESIETFRNSDYTHVSYNVRVDLETEVITVCVPEELTIEEK